MLQDDKGQVLRRNSFHIRKNMNKMYPKRNENRMNNSQRPKENIFYQQNQQLAVNTASEPITQPEPSTSSTDLYTRILKSGRRYPGPEPVRSKKKKTTTSTTS